MESSNDSSNIVDQYYLSDNPHGMKQEVNFTAQLTSIKCFFSNLFRELPTNCSLQQNIHVSTTENVALPNTKIFLQD